MLLAAVQPSIGQVTNFREVYSLTQRNVLFEYAVFATDQPDNLRLELYYQFYNNALEFSEASGTYEAEYEVRINVLDKNKDRVGTFEKERKITVATLRQSRSDVDFRSNQFTVELPPGKYRAELTLADTRSGKVYARDLKFRLKKRDNRLPVLSDMELVLAAGPSGEDTTAFDKNGLTLVPSVAAEFGGSNDEMANRVMFYVEVYDGSDEVDKVRMETVIRKRKREMVYRDSLWLDMAMSPHRQLREISIADLPPGLYDLEVTLKGRRNKRLDRRRKEFTVVWSQDALLQHDYDKAIDQLEYIAQSDEIKALRKAVSPEEKRAGFDAFWEDRDPSPGTLVNETKNEFYRRVRIANLHFGHMRRDGWRTDRGRIYIQYGEPDQVDDNPFVEDGPPSQQWHFYRGGRYRRFTFLDSHFDGDYRLVYPYDGLYQQPDF